MRTPAAWPALLLYFLNPLAKAADETGVSIERIMAVAKTYFRDSAELPMNVNVTTVVTDKSGRTKRRAQSSVRMVFHGYNQNSRRFSLKGDSGWFDTRTLRDSMSGDVAAFIAAAFLMPDKDSIQDLEIKQAVSPDHTILVRNHPKQCASFELAPPGKYLFPRKFCGAAQFTLTMAPADDLKFQHYSFDSAGLPVEAKVQYFGSVRITAFHTEVEFQEGFLNGDPTPFLWPKQVVTLVTTDKGTISITNRYSPRTPEK